MSNNNRTFDSVSSDRTAGLKTRIQKLLDRLHEEPVKIDDPSTIKGIMERDYDSLRLLAEKLVKVQPIVEELAVLTLSLKREIDLEEIQLKLRDLKRGIRRRRLAFMCDIVGTIVFILSPFIFIPAALWMYHIFLEQI